MRILPGVGAAIVLMAAAGGLTPEGLTSAASVARPACCYTNAQYAGVCIVQPAKDESCASIRTYLNNPRSQGKTYCDNTSVRGGWRQVKCPRGGMDKNL
jgi:hypothetical protein